MLFSILFLSLGCDSVADLQSTKAKAQNTADAKIDAAQTTADQASRDAQAKADKTIAGASADFATLREEYRHTGAGRLQELDVKIADLDAQSLSANGAEKTARAARLKTIRANREIYVHDLDALAGSTMAEWEAQKAHVDTRWTTLKASVDAG